MICNKPDVTRNELVCTFWKNCFPHLLLNGFEREEYIFKIFSITLFYISSHELLLYTHLRVKIYKYLNNIGIALENSFRYSEFWVAVQSKRIHGTQFVNSALMNNYIFLPLKKIRYTID